MVVGNFDVVTATASIPFPAAGTWYDYLSQDSLRATGGSLSLSLAPGEYHVFTNRNLNSSSSAPLETRKEKIESGVSDSFAK